MAESIQVRPIIPSTKDLVKVSRDPGEIKERIKRLNIIGDFIQRSGDLAITTRQHQVLRGLYGTLENCGFQCGAINYLFDEIARQSPDTRGISRKEIVQLLEEKNLLLPGAGVIGPAEEKPPGIIARIGNAIRGKDK